MLSVVHVLSSAGNSIKESALMFFATFWALVLGFGLSGVVQSFFRKNQIEKQLGTGSVVCTLRASLFGFASSSCSYAASAMSKSIFQKGADFVSANVFMFASTNLVIELGIVLAFLMGWQFLLAEFIGGAILIALFSLIGKVFFPKTKQAEILEHLNEVTAEAHVMTQEPLVDERSFKTKVFNAASYAISDIKMLKYELLIGFLVAGIISTVIPTGFFKVLFVSNHGLITDIENALVGPIIATVSFVCSVGNIPLAAALFKDGISFSGVMSFIFADLITIPLLLIYKKFYGITATVKMYVSFYLVMAFTGEITYLIFKLFDIVPTKNKISIDRTTFGFNYDFYIDLVFLAVFIAMLILHSVSVKSDTGFAIDPICKMQVDKSNAAVTFKYNGNSYYFCSPKCKERFQEDPGKFVKNVSESEVLLHEDKRQSTIESKSDDLGFAIDPVCNMQVDISNPPAVSIFDEKPYYFCCSHCKQSFDQDPKGFLSGDVKPKSMSQNKASVSLTKKPGH